MSRGCTTDELYDALGAFILASTSRKWWRKAGIQAQPQGPYALVFISENHGLENEVVELEELEPVETTDPSFEEIPWGTALLSVQLELFRGAHPSTALQDAHRLKSALRLEQRYQDLWDIMGISGAVTVIDVSAVFRADTEGRAEVRFQVYANISEHRPPQNELHDINTQSVVVTTDINDTTVEQPITVTGG
jgi:hypothetical protein